MNANRASHSSQLSSLLESLPGIASVLRSPVADAIVGIIRAAIGLQEFSEDEATELIRYAVRRGLIGSDEGDGVLADIENASPKKRKARKPVAKKRQRATTARKPASKARLAAKAKKSAVKAKATPKKRPAKKTAKATRKTGHSVKRRSTIKRAKTTPARRQAKAAQKRKSASGKRPAKPKKTRTSKAKRR